MEVPAVHDTDNAYTDLIAHRGSGGSGSDFYWRKSVQVSLYTKYFYISNLFLG